MKKLSIIIPAYHEGRTIHLILDKIKQVSLLNEIEKEIIIAEKEERIKELKEIIAELKEKNKNTK